MLPTETVIFKIYEKSVPDKIGETRMVFKEDLSVSGCLVQAGSASEMMSGFDLQENQLVSVHIPDTFTENLQNCKAVIRGLTYNIILTPLGVTASPLQWNRHVVCEVSS